MDRDWEYAEAEMFREIDVFGFEIVRLSTSDLGTNRALPPYCLVLTSEDQESVLLSHMRAGKKRLSDGKTDYKYSCVMSPKSFHKLFSQGKFTYSQLKPSAVIVTKAFREEIGNKISEIEKLIQNANWPAISQNGVYELETGIMLT